MLMNLQGRNIKCTCILGFLFLIKKKKGNLIHAINVLDREGKRVHKLTIGLYNHILKSYTVSFEEN